MKIGLMTMTARSKEDKILFDRRFDIFLSKLTQKNRLNDVSKNYYYKTMYKHFNQLLISGTDIDRSLFYVFNIPTGIINFYEINQTRRKSTSVKYFKMVIKYYLENEVSENKACEEIFDRHYSELIKKFESFISFKVTFREWYDNNRNRDSNHEIHNYLEKLYRENMLKKRKD